MNAKYVRDVRDASPVVESSESQEGGVLPKEHPFNQSFVISHEFAEWVLQTRFCNATSEALGAMSFLWIAPSAG